VSSTEKPKLSNIRRLAIEKMSLDAVPKGGGLADAIEFLMDKDRILKTAREADRWAKNAVLAVKCAPGGENMGDDEAIAGEILRQLEAKKKSRAKSLSQN